MSQDDQTARILLGRIVGAHGIRGEVVIHSYAAVPEDVGGYGPLTSADGTRAFSLSGVRAASKGVIARVGGVTDRTAAEALKGTELYVDRARLPAADKDEFYIHDLVGMTVIDEGGAEIGRVVDVANYGAGDLLEVRKIGVPHTELVPFTDAYVPHVDLAARRLVMRPVVYLEDDDA